MTIETALTVARPSAANGATLNSPSHSAASGVSLRLEPREHVRVDAPAPAHGRLECRPGVGELFVVHDIPPSGLSNASMRAPRRVRARSRILRIVAGSRPRVAAISLALSSAP